MGRPTKLTKELVAKARKYIDVEVMHGGLYAGELPQVAALALYLDVARSSIYEWADRKNHKKADSLGPEFSDIVEKVLAFQEQKLVGKSLKGEYNATIARMMLNSKHGYVESTKTDVTTDGQKIDGNPYAALSATDLRKLARGK